MDTTTWFAIQQINIFKYEACTSAWNRWCKCTCNYSSIQFPFHNQHYRRDISLIILIHCISWYVLISTLVEITLMNHNEKCNVIHTLHKRILRLIRHKRIASERAHASRYGADLHIQICYANYRGAIVSAEELSESHWNIHLFNHQWITFCAHSAYILSEIISHTAIFRASAIIPINLRMCAYIKQMIQTHDKVFYTIIHKYYYYYYY